MLNAKPAPKAPPAKVPAPTPKQISRTSPQKIKAKPMIISRQVFNDFAR